MSLPKDTEGSTCAQPDRFTTTHWSIVLSARDPASPLATEALEKLCRTYWYPIYLYLRREGEDDATAKDLTQGFFARMLERNDLAQVQREKGKFRSFLLAALKHYVADEWDKARALKRGGGHAIISFDDTTFDDRYRLEPVDAMDAEKLYERRWALTLLEHARVRVREEYLKAGKAELYDRLNALESREQNAPSYAKLAAELELTESAVKSACFRMRRRYRELVREEVANTLDNPAEVDAEITYLISVVSG